MNEKKKSVDFATSQKYGIASGTPITDRLDWIPYQGWKRTIDTTDDDIRQLAQWAGDKTWNAACQSRFESLCAKRDKLIVAHQAGVE